MGLLVIKGGSTQLAQEVRAGYPSATYNGSMIVSSFVGTKTFSCANKMMASNLVIGGKTLNCANKVMPYDITATYDFVWAKYYATTYYVDTTTNVSLGSMTTTYGVLSSNTYAANSDTAPVLNASTGSYNMGSIASQSTGNVRFSKAYVETIDDSGNGSAYLYYSGGSGSGGSIIAYADGKIFNGLSSAQTVTKHYPTLTHGRGTYIGEVHSTSTSAYTEGYNSDGYWYERLY